MRASNAPMTLTNMTVVVKSILQEIANCHTTSVLARWCISSQKARGDPDVHCLVDCICAIYTLLMANIEDAEIDDAEFNIPGMNSTMDYVTLQVPGVYEQVMSFLSAVCI